ncbi:MAG: hypothetical protein ACI9NC_002858, partial [Verrucomicrobiales bacterium]
PEAARASRIDSLEENFPVPTRRREENSRSAIFNGWELWVDSDTWGMNLGIGDFKERILRVTRSGIAFMVSG